VFTGKLLLWNVVKSETSKLHKILIFADYSSSFARFVYANQLCLQQSAFNSKGWTNSDISEGYVYELFLEICDYT
jgi:hypothetical protein